MDQQNARPLALIIKAADLTQQQGKIYRAIEWYFDVANEEPESSEATEAMTRLLSKAKELAARGMIQKSIETYLAVATSTTNEAIASESRLGLISLGTQLHEKWQPFTAKAVFSDLVERWPATEEAKEARHRLEDLAKTAGEKKLTTLLESIRWFLFFWKL